MNKKIVPVKASKDGKRAHIRVVEQQNHVGKMVLSSELVKKQPDKFSERYFVNLVQNFLEDNGLSESDGSLIIELLESADVYHGMLNEVAFVVMDYPVDAERVVAGYLGEPVFDSEDKKFYWKVISGSEGAYENEYLFDYESDPCYGAKVLASVMSDEPVYSSISKVPLCSLEDRVMSMKLIGDSAVINGYSVDDDRLNKIMVERKNVIESEFSDWFYQGISDNEIVKNERLTALGIALLEDANVIERIL